MREQDKKGEDNKWDEKDSHEFWSKSAAPSVGFLMCPQLKHNWGINCGYVEAHLDHPARGAGLRLKGKILGFALDCQSASVCCLEKEKILRAAFLNHGQQRIMWWKGFRGC